MELTNKMTERTKTLYDSLIERSLSDRSGEWFTQDMLSDIASDCPNDSVIVRRAKAIDGMLRAMTSKNNSEKTFTAYIAPGELLLGTLPMGSNGLGKVFPNYLKEDEKRAGSITNRSSMSLLGHNSLNYSDLLNKGIQAVIDECDSRRGQLEKDKDNYTCCNDSLLHRFHVQHNQHDFYKSVKISCQAVIDFANRLADEADTQAGQTDNEARKQDLLEMARIARKVPQYRADTFHEAVQSIWFFHLALHASMNLISFGRLDQVLNPFLIKEKEYNKCLEILECFLIKAAWRLNMNLTPSNIVKQDHVDNSTVLGTNPYLIDQKAGVNNFLQNIIVGGVKPNGDDATNDCTYLILQAFSNVNLSTPGIYIRVHEKSPEKLLKAVASTWHNTKNNPAIINDEVMIPAMYKALCQSVDTSDEKKMAEISELANDYCVDGCWEPILNGKSDWTFSMLSALTPLECALNQGALLTNDPELLRGAKKAHRTIKPGNYDELLDAFSSQLSFFVDQGVISLFLYYMMDEYACPSPLLSAYLGGCMERGRDKSWGGTSYNIGGIILSGVPNVVNTLAAIRKWVFPENDKGKYTLDQVCAALRDNFVCGDSLDVKTQELFTKIKIDFGTNTPTFGNNNRFADDITKEVLDIYYKAVMKAAEYAKKVYQDKPSVEKLPYIVGLRSISGYYGLSLEEKFGEFNMKITAGLGTFEQYNWMGLGNAASADRLRGQPLAPNFSPVSGTAVEGIGGIFGSLKKFSLNRFAAGVITDTCLEKSQANEKHLVGLLGAFIVSEGAMMTLAIGDREIYREIYEQTVAAQKMNSTEKTEELLKQYAHVNVRIGGWQTPFITLPVSHMENYVQRPVNLNLKQSEKDCES